MLKNIRLPVSAWLLGCLVIVSLSLPRTAAARGLSLIRDAEIENTIRAYAAPVFRAAGLEPSAISIYLVNDKTINAFVADGQKLFINTGLLIKSQNAGQVIGVIAHETGHIAAGHLLQLREAMRVNSAESILALILGGAAVAVSGRGDIGTAIIMGGQEMSKRNFLQYSRTQEAAADAAAMRYLDATGQSSEGMLQFFTILSKQEQLSSNNQDPYYRSHPLTRERIRTVKNHIALSPYTGKPEPPKFELMHRRMKAKLQAFMDPPADTLRLYKKGDPSIEARYARAIAYFRQADLKHALPLIDGLIAEHPKDPYFHELKGQMLFENGRNSEALGPYQKAVSLDPRSPLLRRELARVQIEANDPSLLEGAIENLHISLDMDRTDDFSWRQLAIAYGRLGKSAESSLALGEEALLQGDINKAIYNAKRAKKMLPAGSPGNLQAQDILLAARNRKKN